ncbi:MAG: amino acid decarboxylase, partial [Clostridia bacterium]|nr:amino acid decarboxylase [Clostridia bacterium]
RVVDVLCAVERRAPLLDAPPALERPVQRMSPREAVLSVQEPVAVEQAAGRVLAAASVNCPPAVPIVVCGEVIDQSAVECFRYYGIERVYVVCE